MSAPEFGEGFHGAGPALAAVPPGGPGHHLALTGATDLPGPAPARAESAFPGRGRAGRVADGLTDGAPSRDQGAAGWYACTPARAAAGPRAAGMSGRLPAGPERPAGVRMAPEAGS